MKGKNAEARSFNSFLDAVKNKVYAAERKMTQNGKIITYQTFKEVWFGVDVKQYMILEVFQQHNYQVAQLIGKDFSALPFNQHYRLQLMHLQYTAPCTLI